MKRVIGGVLSLLIVFLLFPGVTSAADVNLIRSTPKEIGKDWKNFNRAIDNNHSTFATLSVKSSVYQYATAIWDLSSSPIQIQSFVFNGEIDRPGNATLVLKALTTSGKYFTIANIGNRTDEGSIKLSPNTPDRINLPEPITNVKQVIVSIYKYDDADFKLYEVQAFAEPLLDKEPPAAPAGLKGTAGDKKVSLQWEKNTETDLKEYIIYQDGKEVTRTRGTSATIYGLANGTSYKFHVTAIDLSGNESGQSNGILLMPRKAPPPEPPASLQARPGYQMVTLTWASSPRDDIVGYRVYQDGKQLPGQQRGPTVDVRGLENDREYRFYVTSISDTGEESGPSPEARATPRSEPAPGTGINPGEVQWGFGPGDILTNSGAILLMLSAFVLLGIVVMYIKPLIGLIREAIKPG